MVQACVKQLIGERWPGLARLPADIRGLLEQKLADSRTIAEDMHLTSAGRSRLWYVYLKGLADTGSPLTPKTLSHWSVGMLTFLFQALPYPRELQARLLNNGLG